MLGTLIKIIFGASLVLLLIAFVLFYLHLAKISNFFIVKFDSIRGINFLGSRADVLGILISGGVISLINIALSATLYSRERFLAALLPFFNLFFSILLLMVIGVIIATN